MEQPDRTQMTLRRMRIACCTTKATNTHSQYVILIAFQQQKWLHERASMLSYTYIACLCSVWGQSESLGSTNVRGLLYQLRELLNYGTFLKQITNPIGLPWG